MTATRGGIAGFFLLMGVFPGLWTGVLALSILGVRAPSGPTPALLGQHYRWQAVALLGGAFVLGSPGSTVFRSLDPPCPENRVEHVLSRIGQFWFVDDQWVGDGSSEEENL
tara:strand:- start:638 stop:970 length:333 start_codon:yes stop_codon:yes gene_type:complete